MPITTYSELKTEAASFAHRDDLASSMDTFIDLAEADMQVRADLVDFEATGTIAITSGSGSLPSGFMGFRSVYVDLSPNRPLNYLTPERFAVLAQNYSVGRYYTVTGSNIKTDLESGNLTATYVAKFTPLSDSNTSNAILASFPDVYLMGVLKQVAIYSEDDQGLMKYGGLFDQAIKRLRDYNLKRKYGNALAVRTA